MLKIKSKIIILFYTMFVFTACIGSKSGSLSNSLYSQLLSSERTIDWSSAGLESTFTYPEDTFNVVTYGATGDGLTDDSTAVQAALAAAIANSGGIVYFPTGSYLLTSNLSATASNIVFKGDGYTNSKLYFTLAEDSAMHSAIRLVGSSSTTSTRTVSSGYEKGSTRLTVSSVSNLYVGQYIHIVQNNDADLMYTTPSWGLGYAPDYWDAGWSDLAVRQYFKITAIDSTNKILTIDKPLYLTYKTSCNVRIYGDEFIENCGVEDLYIERTNDAWGNTITISAAANCQVKNVESYNTWNAHIEFIFCARSYAYHNYIHHSHSYSGGCAYGIEFYGASDCLAEDNIAYSLNKGAFMTHMGAAGNVIAYNYITASAGQVSFDTHGHYDNYNLFESNYAAGAVEIADFWGPAGPGIMMFRNKIMKNELTGFGRGSLVIFDATYLASFVGNLSMDAAYGFLCINDTQELIDTVTASTLQHGNYITGAQSWDSNYSQTLPSSLYLSEKPSFFGTKDWPCYNPSSPTFGTLPAEDRYLSGVYL